MRQVSRVDLSYATPFIRNKAKAKFNVRLLCQEREARDRGAELCFCRAWVQNGCQMKTFLTT